MREILAMLSLIFLVAFGWKQSYQDHFDNIVGNSRPTLSPRGAPFRPAEVAPRPVRAMPSLSPSDRTWMWQPKVLDPAPADQTPSGKGGGRAR